MEALKKWLPKALQSVLTLKLQKIPEAQLVASANAV